jgi:hypothetical protein
MGCRLTSSAGTFAIRDNLSIPVRFFLYNGANVFSHRNTSLVIFVFILMVSIVLRPTPFFPVSVVERRAFLGGSHCHAFRDA